MQNLEFAKLRALRVFALYVPSRHRALHVLRALVLYVLCGLSVFLRALRAFAPSRITCLTHVTYLRALHALFVRVTIFLG